MHTLVTYRRDQYESLLEREQRHGKKVVSILNFPENSCENESLLGDSLTIDVSTAVGLLSEVSPLAAHIEMLIHRMPPDTVFISDESAACANSYDLRMMFNSIENCGLEIKEKPAIKKIEKRTLVSLEIEEYICALKKLETDLIGQRPFKQAFRLSSNSFRLFNPLGEHPILSLLLLGSSGIGKTEVAKILCNAIAPKEPLPKINLGNYSSKDSLNSLIGSPRGYMGSEEGELVKKLAASNAGILLVDEFEKAEPAVWNFFLDLLETGSFTDSLGEPHDLNGYVAVFTTNCPFEKVGETFPAELLSRFSVKAHFSQLTSEEKALFVSRYVRDFSTRYETLTNKDYPVLPDNIIERSLAEIDLDSISNIRILKNATRSWLSALIEKLGEQKTE